MSNLCAVVLAAGEGKRMRSTRPKVMCEVLLKPMLGWVMDALERVPVRDICVVCQPGAKEVINFVKDRAETAFQHERRGTGHAVMQCVDFLEQRRGGNCIILCGDVPFIDEDVIRDAMKTHEEKGAAATVITAKITDPTGYGRILRGADDNIRAIIEHKDADEGNRFIREVNSGAYIFRVDALLDTLPRLGDNNSQNEYYLTDCIGLLTEDGKIVAAHESDNEFLVLGANDPAGLLSINEQARVIVIGEHLANGVVFVSTEGIVIGPDVIIGAGTQVLPNTILRGHTTIGNNCTIGPATQIRDCTIGHGTELNASQALESIIGNGVRVGPFAQIRPGSKVHDHVKIGNFVEVKNSEIGERTSVAHLTYIGDCDVGERVNFGCGTVIVNYDGVNKYRTTIGDDAFIGCNSNLVAPVRVGNRAYTAAGSTVIEDVPDDALCIGRARQVNKAGYAKVLREKLLARKNKGDK